MFGRWEAVVGEQIAAHATPTALNEGVLTVAAESTAWATQLRLVQAQLLAKIAAAIGDGVVTSLKISGPRRRHGGRGHGISPDGVPGTRTVERSSPRRDMEQVSRPS